MLETTDKIGLNGILIDPTKCDEMLNNPTGGYINDFSLERAERELIARALQETGWQKTRAAGLLGITRATLYTKVKHYNIQKGSYVVKQTNEETSAIDSSEPVTVA